MSPERVAEIMATHPWLPEDCQRLLPGVEPGLTRYGLQWLDGPQNPGELYGAAMAAQFPSALWIGRRDGNAVGYSDIAIGSPRLCEWAGSQQRVVRQFSGTDALILALLPPAADMRPVVACSLRVPGVAFGPWRRSGDAIEAPCILSPGLAATAVPAVLDRFAPGWCLTLTQEDHESWISVRAAPNGLQWCLLQHGSAGEWAPIERPAALQALLQAAPFNDGSSSACFARLTWPPPV
ncbi:MAG: hypothetical protein KF740_10390 [Ramlibacter sp.]|nr:hypothetical protein [Ramlibacter sp.]